MASQKQSKIAQIVREFAKQGDSYDITGINLGLAKYFWREAQGTFNDLAIGDYRIDTANGRQTLVVTNQSVVGLMESIQVAYILDFDASSYDTKWNVDINTLKDKYNQLVKTCSGLWDYIRSVGMVADDTTMSLILPQLDTDEIWIKTDTGYTALKVTDFRDMAGASLIEYMKIEKENINQINKHAVESLNTVRNNGITEINNSIGDITAHVDGIELDLTTFLGTLKKSLNAYFNLLNATMLANQKKLEDTLKQVPVQTNEIKNVGKNERVSVMQEGQKQRELLAQDGEQWRDQIKAEADVVLGLDSSISQNIVEGKKVDTSLGAKITEGNTLNTNLGNKINEVPTLIGNINTAGTTQVGNINSAGTRNVGSVNAEGVKQVKSVSDTGKQQVMTVGNEGGRQISAIGAKGTEQVNLVTQQGDLEVAKVNAQGVSEVGKITAEGDKKIAQIQAFPATKNLNINDNQEYSTWLGTESEFDSIIDKQKGVFYMGFNDLFSLTKTWFRPKLEPVKDGLVCWLDAIDGENGNPLWNDRSGNGNDVTLHNFNWTSESGFTGKSLKFDGVNNYVLLDLLNSLGEQENLTVEIAFSYSSFTNGSMVLARGMTTSGQNGFLGFFSGVENSFVRNNRTWIDTLKEPAVSNEIRNYSYTIKNISEVGVFLNGALKNTLVGLNTNYNLSGEFYIGSGDRAVGNSKITLNSIKVYNRVLTPEEIQQNYEYEQSIDRIVPTTYPLVEETKDYCIGHTTDLTEEQKKTFRLSIDKTKFVSGINNIKGIAVETYTYSEIQKIMETPEWRSESDIMQ